MAKKIIPIILIIVGAALLIGVGLFVLDKATSPEPDGLGTWILAVLGLLLGASTGIKGWLDWNKKETLSQTTKNIALDNGQIATGELGRNIQTKDSSQYVEQKIEHYHEAPKLEKPFSPLHQLPQSPADFTGREELVTQLLADFNAHKGTTISGLTGMGGIGKTALGLVVAHKLAERYPDGQIFLDLKGTTTPLSAVDIARHAILSFEPTADLRGLDEVNTSAAYHSVLHGKKVLLFLDNARSAEQIAPLRPPEKCAMLVTSRWTFSMPGLGTRRVDLMTADDARDFLLELCPRISDNAAELAKACAYLPLALRIAGSFLQINTDWSVEKYVSKLTDRKKRLKTFQQSRVDAELTTEPDLLATFDLSYNQLSIEDQKRWRVLGVFAASFAASAARALWEMDDEETTKLLSLLMRYNLLEYYENSVRYGLHDLLTDYALSQMEYDEEKISRINHAQHYLDVLQSANRLYLQGKEKNLVGLQLVDNELQNIIFAQSWIGENANDKCLLNLCNKYPIAGFMILSLRLHPRIHIRWLEIGLEAARNIGDKKAESAHLGNLGNAYAILGEARKIIENCEKSLMICREIGDLEGESHAYGNLGSAYLMLADLHKAIDYYEKQLVIAKRIGLRIGEANSLNNIGLAYAELGERHKAVDFFEKALLIKREIGDRRGEGNSLGNLGNAYRALGDTDNAIRILEQRLSIARELGDAIGESAALNNLGLTFMTLNNLTYHYNDVLYYYDMLNITTTFRNHKNRGKTGFFAGLKRRSNA